MKKAPRLYGQFRPEHYDLQLYVDKQTMTFRGTVKVRGKKAGRPAQRLTFHQKELKVITASVLKHDKSGDHPVNISRVNNHNGFDEVRLHAEGMIYPGSYTVTMEFEGKITRPMNGIYPCFFNHLDLAKILIATQFESHHAREAFPCIDEPEAKATFGLTLFTPTGETVISNTPVKESTVVRSPLSVGAKPTVETKLQKTIFETTPRMSVYLLAFAFGELGFKEAKTRDGITVRTYATPDNVELTGHGLQVAVRALEFFSDYFGVPYPLKKLDMIALPDFSSGAMENWGLVTYRETTMLADIKTGSIESRQLVALVICHELSHQWFGNLVTMRWWDDLWLNESFANLMEYAAVDALYPEWHIWEQFVSNETGSAKRRDSLTDVQPIRCTVRHPDEISTLFDPSIVYAKGGSVLHMLLNHIGEDVFRRGLKLYFDKHQYGNTGADDLWEALSSASGQDITGFMEGWLVRPGYPLVTVDWQPGEKMLTLSQQRFLSDLPSVDASRSELWQVPLAATLPIREPLLTKRTAQTTLKQVDDEPLVLNHDGNSYFLPLYSNADHLKQIIHGIKEHKVDPVDRLLLLDNYTMLQRGGNCATTELLELLHGFSGEENENVWGAIAVALGEARKLVEGDEIHEPLLDKLAGGLVVGLVSSLGWDDKPKDTAQTLRLRGLSHSIAASAKVPELLNEGLKRFRSFKKPGDLPPSTRTVIYYIGARFGSANDFQKLLKLYRNTQNADEKDEIVSGLTATKEPGHYKQLIGMLTTDEIRRQDLMHWFVWLLRNRYSRKDAWHWLAGNWDWIEKEFASDKSYSFFARYCGSVFSRKPELKQFNDLFEPKKSIVSLARDIALAQAEIAARVAWRSRNEKDVSAWLVRLNQSGETI